MAEVRDLTALPLLQEDWLSCGVFMPKADCYDQRVKRNLGEKWRFDVGAEVGFFKPSAV